MGVLLHLEATGFEARGLGVWGFGGVSRPGVWEFGGLGVWGFGGLGGGFVMIQGSRPGVWEFGGGLGGPRAPQGVWVFGVWGGFLS